MIEEKIENIINEIRPYLFSHGGNIEFIKYENNIVFIRMTGACSHCEMLDLTLEDGIETALKDEIPEIKKVINISDINE